MNQKPDHPASPHQAELEAARIGLPRRTLLGVVAAAALGAGATAAWMQRRKASEAAVTTAVPDFWTLQWTTPDGAPLPMQSFQGRPLLINFWATWCPPCVEELPLINAFYQENKGKGWQVLGLAVDKPALVKSFLTKTPLAFPVGMAGLGGTDLSRKLGNLAGGLPFTVAFDSEGGIIQRKMGQVSADDLRALGGLK
jgi:thiol-disulfide isomerase/thioredoxin